MEHPFTLQRIISFIFEKICKDGEQGTFLLFPRTHFPAKRKRGPRNEQVPLKATLQQTGRQADRQLGRSQGGEGGEEEEEKLPAINRQMLTVWGTKGARRREREIGGEGETDYFHPFHNGQSSREHCRLDQSVRNIMPGMVWISAKLAQPYRMVSRGLSVRDR